MEAKHDTETTPAEAGPTPDEERAGGRWYSSAFFWITIGLGLLVAVGFGITWYTLGGFPRNHDKYGRVSVPGQQVLHLPGGEVRVNFETDMTGDGDKDAWGTRPGVSRFASPRRPAASGSRPRTYPPGSPSTATTVATSLSPGWRSPPPAAIGPGHR